MSMRLTPFKDSLKEETFMDKIRNRVASAKKNLKVASQAYAADHKRRASNNPLKPTPGSVFDRMSNKNEELDTLKGLNLPKLKRNLSPNQKKLRKDREKDKVFKKIDIQDNTNRGGGELVVGEDAQYNAKPGGHEWGTAKGTEYYKKLTPGQSPKQDEKIKPVDVPIKEANKSGDQGLRDWFGKSKASDGTSGWVQMGGKFSGKPCARQPGQTSTPKCGSSKMKRNLDKDEEERAFRRKNREDGNQPDKRGGAKPTNVKTEQLSFKDYIALDEVKDKPGKGSGKKDACYNKVKSRYNVWPSAYASGALVRCRKVGAKNWGNKSEAIERHGVPKDATKSELKAIRSNPKSSKGAKDLAHWKLNMHHQEDIAGAIKSTIQGLANPNKITRQKVSVAGRKYNPKTPLSKSQEYTANLNKNMSHGLKQALRRRKVAWVDDVNHDEELIEGLNKELLAYISQVEEHGFTEQDILEMEKEVDSMDLEDFLSLGGYSDEDFEDEDYNNDGALDVYDDLNITEVLTIQGRIKRRFAARRNRQKLKVARMRALRRSSSPDRIKLRSTRAARNFMYKRLLRGRDKTNLPPSEKQRLEKLIQRFQPIVSRIAIRMLPQMRKKEVERLKRRGSMTSQKAKKFRVAKGGSASKYKAKKFKITNKPTIRPKLTKKAKAVGRKK